MKLVRISVICSLTGVCLRLQAMPNMQRSLRLPFTIVRTEYISCFCCPPNTLRTVCQAQNYAYTLADKAVYCNLYGSNTLQTELEGLGMIALAQHTDYPWEGSVRLVVESLPRASRKTAFSIYFRMPEWCDKATLTVNGQVVAGNWKRNEYAHVNRIWKEGDIVEWVMDMPVRLLEAHPLAEEIRNQVVVKRGPIVYCLESMDIDGGKRIDDVQIPTNIKFTPRKMQIAGSDVMALEGIASLNEAESWEGVLYREVNPTQKPVHIRLIPYYAWGNRGKSEMTVWMPVKR